jgi:EpsI family protein
MKKLNIKQLITAGLLLLTILGSFYLPKAKYQSINILKEINIPSRMPGWQSQDISGQLNPQDKRYNFIGDVFARVYTNKYGESLVFLVLDAGNFHNPKVCFGGSGYEPRDVEKIKIESGASSFLAQTVFMKKTGESRLVVYWLCIDKKIASWGQQKAIELWSTLINKKKPGLMVRLEIPASEETIPFAVKLVQEFISELKSKLSAQDAEYVFGK